jgi:hypothetical protein
MAQETSDLIGILKGHLQFCDTPRLQTKVMMSIFGLFPRIDVTSRLHCAQKVPLQGVSKANNLVAPKMLTTRCGSWVEQETCRPCERQRSPQRPLSPLWWSPGVPFSLSSAPMTWSKPPRAVLVPREKGRKHDV